MAESVTITLFGDDFFIRRIRAIRYRSLDLHPVLDDIADLWADIIDHQFETEGKRSGHPWAPLERETWLRRKSQHPILIDSGDLFESLGRDNIHANDDSVTIRFGVGKDAKKAEAHQYGYFNVAAQKEVPARPIVDFTELDAERFRRKISKYLIQGDRSSI